MLENISIAFANCITINPDCVNIHTIVYESILIQQTEMNAKLPNRN